MTKNLKLVETAAIPPQDDNVVVSFNKIDLALAEAVRTRTNFKSRNTSAEFDGAEDQNGYGPVRIICNGLLIAATRVAVPGLIALSDHGEKSQAIRRRLDAVIHGLGGVEKMRKMAIGEAKIPVMLFDWPETLLPSANDGA